MADISSINSVSDGFSEHYTPTTEEVRGEYADATGSLDANAEFDRWLGAVKAEAVAEWLAERMAAFKRVTLEDYEQGEIE